LPARLLGTRPMTTLERQNRWRERQAERAALAAEAVRFVLALRPDAPPPRKLVALQRKLQKEDHR
jgi:hypothetical protein